MATQKRTRSDVETPALDTDNAPIETNVENPQIVTANAAGSESSNPAVTQSNAPTDTLTPQFSLASNSPDPRSTVQGTWTVERGDPRLIALLDHYGVSAGDVFYTFSPDQFETVTDDEIAIVTVDARCLYYPPRAVG